MEPTITGRVFSAFVATCLIATPAASEASGSPSPSRAAGQFFYDLDRDTLNSLTIDYSRVQNAYGQRPVEYRFLLLSIMRRLQLRKNANYDGATNFRHYTVDPFPLYELAGLADHVGLSGIAGLEPLALYLIDSLSLVPSFTPDQRANVLARLSVLAAELGSRSPIDPLKEHPFYAPLGRHLSKFTAEVRPDHLFLALRAGLNALSDDISNGNPTSDLDDWMTSQAFKDEACGSGDTTDSLASQELNTNRQDVATPAPPGNGEADSNQVSDEVANVLGSAEQNQKEAAIDLCTDPTVSLGRALQAGMGGSCLNMALSHTRGDSRLLRQFENMRQCANDLVVSGNNCSLCGWPIVAGVISGAAGLATIALAIDHYRSEDPVQPWSSGTGMGIEVDIPPAANEQLDADKSVAQLELEADGWGEVGEAFESKAQDLEAQAETAASDAETLRNDGKVTQARIKEQEAAALRVQASEERRRADNAFSNEAKKDEAAQAKRNGVSSGGEGLPATPACDELTSELYQPFEFDPQDTSIYEDHAFGNGPLPPMEDGFLEMAECAAQTAAPLFNNATDCEAFIGCMSGTDCKCGMGLEDIADDWDNFVNEYACASTTCPQDKFPRRDGMGCMCEDPVENGGGQPPPTPAGIGIIDLGLGNPLTVRKAICADALAGATPQVMDSIRDDGMDIGGSLDDLRNTFDSTGQCIP